MTTPSRLLLLLVFAHPALAATPARSALSTAAEAAFQAHQAEYAAGVGDVEEVYRWSRRWLEADRAVPGAAAAHRARMAALAAAVHQEVQAGSRRRSDELATAWYVAEADTLAGP